MSYEFTYVVFSDINLENLCCEVYLNDELVALITDEEGFRVEFFSNILKNKIQVNDLKSMIDNAIDKIKNG